MLAATGVVSAHRLDENLQAARIGVEADRVEIELALTPGVATADAIIGDIDRDHDGTLSIGEQRAFASTAIGALRLDVDGHGLTLTPIAATFPDVAALRTGSGIIQLKMAAAIAQTAGKHHVTFTNDHHPAGSVYLANALVPESDRIAVTAQRRDANQRTLTIDYTVRPETTAAPTWMIASAIGALAAIVVLGRAGLLQRVRARAVAADAR